jgi:hypothetical protein
VWRVLLPTLPWGIAAPERERSSLLAKLGTVLPYRALWHTDWASGERAGWRLLNRGEPLASLADDLSRGAWAMFFFEADPSASIDPSFVPAEPADAAVAVRVVREVGAAAGIWSWYDDTEWLVAAL